MTDQVVEGHFVPGRCLPLYILRLVGNTLKIRLSNNKTNFPTFIP